MDFSKFSDKNFEAKKWVNEALKAQKDSKTPLDGQASMLVMKLQLFIQEVSNSLEESSNQVVQSLPRVLRDIDAVKQEAMLLREQMQIVKEDIKQVERETSNSMQRLVELDKIKTRMKESQIALQEADNWTTLSSDVEEVFATKDIELISEKVIGMHQSLNVLHDVPDYKERHKLLETLKSRLEALLVPLLMEAFNGHLTDEANNYSKIFSDIGRESSVKGYYIQCHKNYVQQLWTEHLKQQSNPLTDTLDQFYEGLLIKWTSEYSWCSSVFPSPVEMLGSLFRESLNSLTPPITQSLRTMINKSSSPIDTLITLRNVMKNFLSNLKQSFRNTEDISIHGNVLFSLVESFHLPYCQLLIQYGALQQQVLVKELTAIVLEEGSPEVILQSVSMSVPKMINVISSSIESCVRLTDGWGVNALIKSIETIFFQYLKKVSVSLQKLRISCGLGEHGNQTLNETESGKDQWINLKWAFQFIRHCGDLILRVLSLNSQICSVIRSSGHCYSSPASPENPFDVYDYLRTFYPEEHTTVMELYASMEKAGTKDIMILSKSVSELKSITSDSHTLAFDIIFMQLKSKLLGVPHLKVWDKGISSPVDSPRALMDDLPTFSRSPLAYITEIGDYLLTLPQQLEPFTSQDDPTLVAALSNSKLPYISTTKATCTSPPADSSGDHMPSTPEAASHTDQWLSAIAMGTMDTYVKSISQIPRLNDEASQQLATDIGYLCNVLAALDQQPSSALLSIEKLLKAPDKQMFEVYKGNKDIDSNLYKVIFTQRTFT